MRLLLLAAVVLLLGGSSVTSGARVRTRTKVAASTSRTGGGTAPRAAVLVLPSHLLPCYENQTLFDQATRLPPTMATLLSLIGKVERASGGSNLDMRMLATSLLHRFRVDGIQREPDVPFSSDLVPFTLTGRQYPKYQVVMDQLVPPGTLFPEEALKDFEKCSLHFMLSSTVQPWERGDEYEVCPLLVGGRSRNPAPEPRTWTEWPSAPVDPDSLDPDVTGEISRCPIEEGVVWTTWGAVGVAPLLTGIAASLQPQSVSLSALLSSKKSKARSEAPPNTAPVDNVWGSTLSGDLAEVAVYQGPFAPDSTFMRMGPGGRWNASALTRIMYFDPWTGEPGGWEEKAWDMTEAEMRGGIDGLVLGSKLQGWISRQGSLRLTQLLDMYYSERGVAWENAIRACRRADLSADVVLLDTLYEQTTSFAFVLSDQVNTLPIAPSAIARFSKSAVDAYFRFSETVLLRDIEIAPCVEGIVAIPRIELLTILDGSWTLWEGQKVISLLERYTDVSTFGSAISVMDGWTGVAIVNFTRLAGYTIRALEDPLSWPTNLNMEMSMRGARKLLMRRRAVEAKRAENVAANSRGTVVLFLANTASNDQNTLNAAFEEFNMAKAVLPDVTWLFVTSRRREDYERFVEDPTRDIITAQEAELDSFMPTLISRLREVPGRIVPAMCPSLVQESLLGLSSVTEWVPVVPRGPHNEDYVTPGEQRLYRIPSAMLLGTAAAQLTVRASNYGDLSVCTSRVQPGVAPTPIPFPKVPADPEERCENLPANGQVQFTITEPCSNVLIADCRPVFVWLIVQRSEFKCTESDCRYPDQVRFSLWHEGLNPLPGCLNAGSRVAVSLFALATVALTLFSNKAQLS